MAVQNGTAEISRVLHALEQGNIMVRFIRGKKQPLKKLFCLREDTFEILQYPIQRGKSTAAEESISIREVKEVRAGPHSKDFDYHKEGLKDVEEECCFVVLYGMEFNLRTLSIAALDCSECDAWVKALSHLTHPSLFKTPLLVQRWLMREFRMLDQKNSGSITQNDLRKFLVKINNKSLLNQTKQIFQLRDKFLLYCSDRQSMSRKDLEVFLTNNQGEKQADDPSYVEFVMNNFAQKLGVQRDLRLTLSEFLSFLFSTANSILDKKYNTVNQDMDRPLSHYWIASSHNTYLTGNQISGESSLEAYIRTLQSGCRCIELDCWNGSDGQPIIYHGHTLTSKIRFTDVIMTIKKYAFVTSPYPVILSIEQHCDLEQQRFMAKHFQEVFGEMLVTQPVDPGETTLPSPNQLKRKIILKHKKLLLQEQADITSSFSEGESFFSRDSSYSARNGVLYMRDPIDKIWERHYFVLTNEKLFFTREALKDEEQAEKEIEEPEVPTAELHIKEKWFHGKLAGGRVDAEKLLAGYSGESGAFLVRESASYAGYCLSFVQRGNFYHCRIQTMQNGGNTKYYLLDQTYFDSIYELIENYKMNPLRSPGFRDQILSVPVPQQNSHLGEPWFHPILSWQQAEDMLKAVHVDGSFLVRPSEQRKGAYSISFRGEGNVRHCRIVKEGNQYVIGSAAFDSLSEIVEYYKANPLYRGIKLKYAANDEVVKSMTEEAGNSLYTHPEYFALNQQHPSKPLTCRALWGYDSQKDDELSFRRGETITNVKKVEKEWWIGDCGGKLKGWFPANFVEEVVEEGEPEVEKQEPTEEDQTTDLSPLAVINIHDCSIETNKLSDGSMYLLKIYRLETHSGASRRPLIEIATESMEESLAWKLAIEEVKTRAKSQEEQILRLQSSKKIARELSDMVVYCCPIPLSSEGISAFKYNQMLSVPETKMEKFVFDKANVPSFVVYSNCKVSRVYPKGHRVDSSNYDPLPMWNAGAQMLSLNYQTADKPMQLNYGRFLQNGKCGYVLMPNCMFEQGFNPLEYSTHAKVSPVVVTIQIIGARHLVRQGRGICSPLVEVEVCGISEDRSSFRTVTCKENGFNPIWNDSCEFLISNPDMALLRFAALDEDMFGDPNFIGQAVFPFQCIKTGFRSVPLKNACNEDLELSTLLVHVDIKRPFDDRELHTLRTKRDAQQKAGRWTLRRGLKV